MIRFPTLLPHNGGMRRRLVTFAIGALLVGLATPSRAEPTADSNKAFEEGRKQADAHDYPRAIEAFERSLTLAQSIGASFNLAFCYEQVKRPDDALAAYHRAQGLALKTNDPASRTSTRRSRSCSTPTSGSR